MTDIRLSEEQKQLIEELGVFHEQTGLQPAAARIISLLLVSDKYELTFDEIREALNLSKSATSNALNFLLSISRIEYITLPGDRKRYFRTPLASWERELQRRVEGVLKGNSLLRKVLAQRPADTPEFNKKLEEVIAFTDYMQEEMKEVIRRWKESSARR
ncbi:GbsR/MarR family transcriptional regulator [Cesiribacter andamanensis]|uniref:HTH marR-type domain-containing protein n=1 Tax=Cesiribacter andamanensis AMV16 TaxID=1279009 RepID=M7N4V2_9BACT|nr:hypothetical protein [Cesiribacter andamanensis]EMR02317.1 hypothetical protein ADICEAN_02554 [Cesiribacter andamanensis AMV16]